MAILLVWGAHIEGMGARLVPLNGVTRCNAEQHPRLGHPLLTLVGVQVYEGGGHLVEPAGTIGQRQEIGPGLCLCNVGLQKGFVCRVLEPRCFDRGLGEEGRM